MTKIFIPVDTLTAIQNSPYPDERTVIDYFGMPLPSHVQLDLTADLVNQMKEVQQLLNQHSLARIEFLSSFHRDTNKSWVTFYRDGDLLPISQYEDFDKLWPTIEQDSFRLCADSLYGGQFTAEFIYGNGSCAEIVFHTHHFSV